jgi:hypothetical protein
LLPLLTQPVYAAQATEIKIWNGTEMQTTLWAQTLCLKVFFGTAPITVWSWMAITVVESKLQQAVTR